MKKLKEIWFLMATTMICLCVTIHVKAEESKRSMENMSGEECLEVLTENGLVIPEDYKDYPYLEEFVKNIVDSVIENPRRMSWFNYTHAEEFAQLIRQVVLDYEGIGEYASWDDGVVTFADDRSKLQYSLYLTVWDERLANYNCYAYAINKPTLGMINPGVKVGVEYSPTTLSNMTIDRLAALVSYDLQELKYTDITYGRSLPVIQSGYRIIAVRKCKTDYHVMYMYSAGVWHHKLGRTAPLRYKYSFLTQGKWTDEGLYREQYQNPKYEYDSDIIYIKYKE